MLSDLTTTPESPRAKYAEILGLPLNDGPATDVIVEALGSMGSAIEKREFPFVLKRQVEQGSPQRGLPGRSWTPEHLAEFLSIVKGFMYG